MGDYYILRPSDKKEKKYMVTIVKDNKPGKTIHFGGSNYTDFILENDEKTREHWDIDPEEVKRRYRTRHHKENHGISGIKKAGFWAWWILWNKPTLKESIKATEKKFNIKIYYAE